MCAWSERDREREIRRRRREERDKSRLDFEILPFFGVNFHIYVEFLCC